LDALPWLAAMGSLICVVLALFSRPRASRDPFWAAAPLMMLALPLSWAFYAVLMLPWMLLALARTEEPWRRYVIAVSATITCLFLPNVFLGITWPPAVVLACAVAADHWPTRRRAHSEHRLPRPEAATA
jgi:hypothetical protein